MEAITRSEKLMDGQYVEPITREEKILAGEDIETVTRREYFLKKYRGGGGDISVVQLSVTENGVYTAPSGKAYSPVNVNVAMPENAYFLKSAAGLPSEIASFSDGASMPMKELEVSIVPTQSGSGEPSPTNVRPISGWTACNVTDCGVNLWDEEWEVGGLVIASGQPYDANDRIRSKNYSPCKPSTSYYVVAPSTSLSIFWYDNNKNYLSRLNVTPNAVQEFPSNAYYFKIVLTGGVTTYNNDISINYPSTDTSYHAYNGNTYTIQFTDGTNPLTVYGGTLDVTSGVLTVDRMKINMTSITDWVVDKSAKRIYKVINAKPATSGSVVALNLLSNRFKSISTDQIYSYTQGVAISTGSALQFHIDGLTDDADVTQAMVNQYFTDNSTDVVYILATPQTYSLNPTAVASILGMNNVFADTGEVNEVQYLSKEV